MTRKPQKPPRIPVAHFIRGQTTIEVTIRFNPDDIEELSPLIQSTGEVWLAEAIKTILLTLTKDGIPSEFVFARETTLNLLSEYAKRTDSVFKRKLNEAFDEAAKSVSDYLLERGITE